MEQHIKTKSGKTNTLCGKLSIDFEVCNDCIAALREVTEYDVQEAYRKQKALTQGENKTKNGEGLHMGLCTDDYTHALNSQNACNVSGLIFSLNEIQQRINHTSYQHGYGTDWRNHHPIVKMFIHQISFLCGNGESIETKEYSACVEFCKYVTTNAVLPDEDYRKHNLKYWE